MNKRTLNGKTYIKHVSENEVEIYNKYYNDIKNVTNDAIAKYSKRGKVDVETFKMVLENSIIQVFASHATIMELYGYTEEEISDYITKNMKL